jgi:hypothetical protein
LNSAETFIKAHFPEDHPARRSLVLETGLTQLAAGSLTEAKSALLQANAVYSRGKAHVTNEVQTLSGLARVEIGLGDLQAAAAYAAQAGQIASQFSIAGAPSYWVGYSLLTQAKVDEALHEAAPARDLAARAMSQLIPTVGRDHPLALEAARMAQLQR